MKTSCTPQGRANAHVVSFTNMRNDRLMHILYSYGIPVACYVHVGGRELARSDKKFYSQTTSKHRNAFLTKYNSSPYVHELVTAEELAEFIAERLPFVMEVTAKPEEPKTVEQNEAGVVMKLDPLEETNDLTSLHL